MSREFSTANTCVFWDVEDCPIRDGDDPDSVYQNIKSALANERYRGTVDIWAYGEKNRTWDEFVLAGITVIPEGDKCGRRYRMMSDVLFWALDNPSDYPVQPNVMVISQNISEDAEFIHVLQILEWRYYKVLLAAESDKVASVEEHDFVSSVWLWTNLLAGGNPIDQSGSTPSVDNKQERKERSTSIPSGSSKDAANKRKRKKRRKSRGDSGGMKSKSPGSREQS